jgi:carbonic anhydrase
MGNTEKLLDGFKRFQKQYFGDDSRLYESMKTGQPAKTLMVACCDSRVDPAILTSCDPGDLFIVRNVANLMPPCEDGGDYHGTSAALEYAVNALEVENIIIMGHSSCGGIRALWEYDGSQTSKFIHKWVLMASKAKDWVLNNIESGTEEEKIKACEQRAVLQSLGNLMTFDCVSERVKSGQLSLHGWYFDIPEGDLLCFNPDSGNFETVSKS